ncbi:lipoprotein YerB [Mesobacillus campisalis]|uniref:Lipoprotein YerB n=1 Tax=Mesobacillus campisalis TaxID=1408103 RepID=A0A0M2SNF4_9BACI|nr:DUF3048 domain-containing protein [Mesobacillus campisalis]KKK34190.1 lipoprotein YerB [Mesobacillus campisalis]
MKKWVASLAAVLLLLQGCSQERDEAIEQPDEKVDSVKEEEFAFHFPLTGVGTKTEAEQRAVAVIVNNHPQARPQSGLHKADIVYEVLAEGDVTRFLAIYESEQPEKVGPVRSAREYFIELAKGYDSLFVAHGYSPEAKELLASGYIDELNGIQYDGSLFKRADFRKAPHNSYITFDNIEKGAGQKGYKMDPAPAPLPFRENDQPQGKKSEAVMISYGNPAFDVQYEYDQKQGKYHRYSDGEESIDLESKEPVLLDNILIVEMNHKVLDDAGRRSIGLSSGGRGYLLQKGVMNEVQWENVNGRILPFIDGKQAGFVPGKTWINIVPSVEQVAFAAE